MTQTPDTGADQQPAPPTTESPPRPPGDPQLANALEAAANRPTGPSRVTLGLAGAVLLVGGFGGGYVVGHQTADDQQAAADRGVFPGGFTQGGPDGSQPPGAQAPNIGDLTAGTITKVDGDTITIKTSDGDEVTVQTDSGTDVTVTKDGSVSDLSTGDQVVVSGNRDSDGSISADSIAEGSNRLGLAPGSGS
jgi:uncharacterized protein DUF5666